MRILLDTNMLLDAIKFHVDVVSEAQKFGRPFTLNACIHELERISKGRSKEAMQAKIALALAMALPVAKAEGSADRAILSYSTKHRCSVATNDKKLIKALKSKGIEIIRLRQKRYLVEE